MIITDNRRQALDLAFDLAGLDLLKRGHSPELHRDEEATKRAGYPIYRGETPTPWVSDLGARFEVNFTIGTRNIWIEEPEF